MFEEQKFMEPIEEKVDREWRITARGGQKTMPLMQQYAKKQEQDVAHVYKLRP